MTRVQVSDVGGLRDPLGVRELYIEQERRKGGRRSRKAVGEVTYGRWQVDRLSGRASITEMPRPDPARWDLYFMEVPHSLRFDSPERTSNWVDVAFEVTGADVTAYDLLPRSVTDRRAAPETFAISAALRFTSAEGVLRGSVHEIRLTGFTPITRSFGLGERIFGWHYEAVPQEVMTVGDRTGCVILQVPKGFREISVRAASRFPAERRFASGRSEPFPFTVELPA